ncbi:Frq1 calcium-binding caltractin-like protein [Encephalitozoon intestinalis ATCC 50506]|uniref:Frq1 calcium-binding caltractin-like protein n=1 Tax=Encephalitozoon intestinalis (strain ATCC 50506) TaxID=876142 RepID=E0S847_ENCIT|nr:Frq1 calcium-binding caltractin-like protein [Encephalitozoon intestinalis ATCC 50506]ADM11882.1 Frq1 calcium-binding caltractin-like protein [Encephalitozoon intestinalis ATCC 50506]UTX45638.1 caltractin [Encephalitozoon intestinalis]
MRTMKEQWDSFETGNLTKETTKDLLRLCGFAPREKDISIPRTFDEFEQLASSIASPIPKDEMKKMLKMFIHETHITKQDLGKYMSMGDKLSEEEMEEFFRSCPFDRNGEITADELLDFLYGSQ